MNREAKREIRRVLMGRTLIAEDGRLVAMEKGQIRMPIGVMDGAGATCFFGICKKARRLKVSCGTEQARRIAFGVMQDVGRLLYLPQQPQAVACLIRYFLTRPTVLIFDYQDDVPVLSAWSGRGLTGWLSNRRALNAFCKHMPKQFALSEKAVPKDEDEHEKEAKKKEKQEKKAARQKEKAARQKPAGKNKNAAGKTQPNTEAKR